MNKYHSFYAILVGMGLLFFACRKDKLSDIPLSHFDIEVDSLLFQTTENHILYSIPILEDINIGCYFDFMDTLVAKYDSLTPYPMSEHLIVRNNPWIIDAFENTDYYRLIKRGLFNYNNRELVILKMGDTLHLPDWICAEEIFEKFNQTTIDLNIPEFKLRVLEDSDTIYTFPVRVGRKERKYLKMAGHEVELETKPGVGKIYRIKRDPSFINPSDGEYFSHTKRDDGKTTMMPLTPWIEPELNGHRYGHLIHPTTNPKTLGKAYSNGCVGVRESDIWRIYYYAPVGTKVTFRYDLEVLNDVGDTIQLKDIYGE